MRTVQELEVLSGGGFKLWILTLLRVKSGDFGDHRKFFGPILADCWTSRGWQVGIGF